MYALVANNKKYYTINMSMFKLHYTILNSLYFAFYSY